MHERWKIGTGDALLVIDVQNDFCAGGALSVPGGDEIVPIITPLACLFGTVVLTQDWHPADHISFASQHKGRKAFETITLSYGAQTLWPDHCVQQSRGAEFHHGLIVPQASLILRKGMDRAIDSYSAFQENDRKTKTGLAGYLRERGIARLFLAGLAYDVCVRYSAEDARAAGFDVIVVEDACRGLDIAGSMRQARVSLAERSCGFAQSPEIG
jgi:nicotinamidase/pyrazinamidase